MITRSDAALGAVIPAQALTALAPLGDPRQQALGRALQHLVGQQLQGQVLARLADGSAVVRVAENATRMQLPPAIPAGAEVSMTLVAALPRPTFQIGAGAASVLAEALPTPHAGSAAAALEYAQGAAAAPPHADGHAAALADSATVTFSATAQTLSRVLASAIGAGSQAATVTAPAPLLPAAGMAPGQIAQALGKAIAESGIFYESHLAEWAGGARSLDSLQAEPQMRRPPADQAQTAQYLAPQLAAHEQQQVVWQGQLTSGLPLEWRIGRDTPRRDHGDDAGAASQAWHSGLRLRFPLLGELVAKVGLRGGALDIRLEAASPEVAALLRLHAPQLAAALDAVGTPLSGFAAGAATQAADD